MQPQTPTLDQLTPDIIKQAHAEFTNLAKNGDIKKYLERWNELFTKAGLGDPSQNGALKELMDGCNPTQAEQTHQTLLVIGWLIGRYHEQAVVRAGQRAA